MEHEKKELSKFRSRAKELSTDWQSYEIQIVSAFGVNVYKEGERILRDFKDKEINHRDIELNDNIRSIEVKLKYVKCRAEIGWLEQSDDPKYGHEPQEETVTNYLMISRGKIVNRKPASGRGDRAGKDIASGF